MQGVSLLARCFPNVNINPRKRKFFCRKGFAKKHISRTEPFFDRFSQQRMFWQLTPGRVPCAPRANSLTSTTKPFLSILSRMDLSGSEKYSLQKKRNTVDWIKEIQMSELEKCYSISKSKKVFNGISGFASWKKVIFNWTKLKESKIISWLNQRYTDEWIREILFNLEKQIKFSLESPGSASWKKSDLQLDN